MLLNCLPNDYEYDDDDDDDNDIMKIDKIIYNTDIYIYI